MIRTIENMLKLEMIKIVLVIMLFINKVKRIINNKTKKINKIKYNKNNAYDRIINKERKMANNLKQIDLMCENKIKKLKDLYGINQDLIEIQKNINNIKNKINECA